MSAIDLLRRYRALPKGQRATYRRKFFDAVVHQRFSFSQFGEDTNALEWLRLRGVTTPQYLDVGANHPVIHSNTFGMYREGGTGVLLEANPALAARLKRKRPRDTIVNKAIAPTSAGAITLHVMNVDGLSTTSGEWAERLRRDGLVQSERTIRVETVGINDLLLTIRGRPLHFASIDVEGVDYDVLTAWDFDLVRPLLLCVETGVVSNSAFSKDGRFKALLASRAYEPIFETFSNTIFVDREAA